MTQTIHKCNEILAGKTYPVYDLRDAESIEQLCEYVDAGHPIANCEGDSVMLFCKTDVNRFTFFEWHKHKILTITSWLLWDNSEKNILDYIKLAPLAYRNGRPLHVGDEIVFFKNGTWVSTELIVKGVNNLRNAVLEKWRFADEVQE